MRTKKLQCLILLSNLQENLWQTEKRISNLIVGVMELDSILVPMFKQPPFVSKKQPFQQLPLMIQVQMHDQTSFYINIFPLWETLLSCPHSRRLGPTYQLFHSRRSVSPNLFQLPKYQNTHNFCYNWIIVGVQLLGGWSFKGKLYEQHFYNVLLTLLTLRSVCIFSILFYIHFQRCLWGEFV